MHLASTQGGAMAGRTECGVPISIATPLAERAEAATCVRCRNWRALDGGKVMALEDLPDDG